MAQRITEIPTLLYALNSLHQTQDRIASDLAEFIANPPQFGSITLTSENGRIFDAVTTTHSVRRKLSVPRATGGSGS